MSEDIEIQAGAVDVPVDEATPVEVPATELPAEEPENAGSGEVTP